MRKIIKKYPSVLYYIFVLAISSVLLIPQNVFSKVSNYSVSFPQLAPTLAVLSIYIITKNRDVWIRFKDSFSHFAKNSKWVPVILVISITAVASTAGVLSLFGLSYHPWEGSITFHMANIVAMIFGCMFEEIGWRGFLLPTLAKKYTPFISTLIVGVLWGFWHMSFNLGIFGFLMFIVSAMELSILMTWIYYKTNGNLLLMMIWHVSINTTNQFLLRGRLTAEGFTALVAVLAVISLFVVIFNKDLFMKKRPDLSIVRNCINT
ncbi:CPBP family intramembrane glutamic endopeptidase [Clostridium estertheticum]|uniref:CPBP family intramembrane glutamic endopeptidase n=1 Tax=Clostridium estertheticum TaxID=238834 RepID=UPI001CF5D233|nr:type II CAAX endopeptidase family protein [Clostridium estertheticum]MCB2343054.1 CPBP family intramembrane metalloprotease [Clostridium estertheticum]